MNYLVSFRVPCRLSHAISKILLFFLYVWYLSGIFKSFRGMFLNFRRASLILLPGVPQALAIRNLFVGLQIFGDTENIPANKICSKQTLQVILKVLIKTTGLIVCSRITHVKTKFMPKIFLHPALKLFLVVQLLNLFDI